MSVVRKRLPGGKWISKVLPESTPLRLQGKQPNEIWDMGNGRRIVVTDMETRHLLNAVKFVETRALNQMLAAGIETNFGSLLAKHHAIKLVLGSDCPAYMNMVKELDSRLHPRPKTEEPKQVRAFSFE